MSNRTLDWASALRDLKADRASRPVIREERLKTTAGLRGSPALPLSAWRGRSGRRYVVGVHSARGFDVEEMAEAVIVAVRRDAQGYAERINIAAFPVEARNSKSREWLDAVRSDGCTELHVHRLASDTTERAFIVSDLTEVE
jgi:hypothetical protein